MSQEEIIRRGILAFEAEKLKCPKEGFQRLIDKGFIDKNGEVIFVNEENKNKSVPRLSQS